MSAPTLQLPSCNSAYRRIVDALGRNGCKPKETGGRCQARCPAHDDCDPSLSLKQTHDRALLNCFAGCETEDVLSALGLAFSDVMPERIGQNHTYKLVRNRITAKEALGTLDHESLVVAIIGADILEHKRVDDETWARLASAVERINTARAMCAPARVGR